VLVKSIQGDPSRAGSPPLIRLGNPVDVAEPIQPPALTPVQPIKPVEDVVSKKRKYMTVREDPQAEKRVKTTDPRLRTSLTPPTANVVVEIARAIKQESMPPELSPLALAAPVAKSRRRFFRGTFEWQPILVQKGV
jgi:hypothetical protein